MKDLHQVFAFYIVGEVSSVMHNYDAKCTIHTRARITLVHTRASMSQALDFLDQGVAGCKCSCGVQ